VIEEAHVADLASIVGERYVRTDPTDRLAYNADCSPRGIIRARGRVLEERQPAAVVQPGAEEELARIVDWARETETALVPFGAGSGVCLGAVGGEASVIVDLKRFDAIAEVDSENRYARVQAGVVGMLLERDLRRRGWTMGHIPSSLYCSSVGGYVAARSAGQYSSRYGKMEDMVASLRVVTGRGDVIETAPNPLRERPREQVSDGGPNLTQLIIGSEGTLGFVTEATVHIEREPDHRCYRGFSYESLADGLEGIRRVMQEGLRPAVVRLYDPYDSLFKSGGSEGVDADEGPDLGERIRRVAEHYLPDAVLDRLRETVEGVRDGLVAGVLDRPQLVHRLLDPLASDALLIVGFEGTSRTVEREAEHAFEILRNRGEDRGAEPGRNWLRHRFDASYLQSPLFDTGAWVDTMEISTTWENLEHLYETVREALEPFALTMAHFSHVYPEGSSIYYTFVGHGSTTEEALDRHERAWSAALDAVVEAGGSITHHHGVGSLKTDWVEHDHVGGGAAFDALKETFDPDGILNPGTVYPGLFTKTSSRGTADCTPQQ